MSYPDDKDTFRRGTGYVSGPVVDANKVKEGDQNNMATWLENLQDTLGYGIKMGYASMKAFFDALLIIVGGKVSKTGDTITGNLTVEGRGIFGSDYEASENLIVRQDQNGATVIEVYNANNQANSKAEFTALTDDWNQWCGIRSFPSNYTPLGGLFSNDAGIQGYPGLHLVAMNANMRIFVGGQTSGDLQVVITTAGQMEIERGDVEIKNNAKGIILNSATKRWRVTINDSGTLVTTEI